MDAAVPSVKEMRMPAVPVAAAELPRPALGQHPDAYAAPISPIDETRELRFGWTGSPWRLFGACLFNAFMSLITIGIYSFWGRTEIRRRMWSSVRLDGEPLVYHGTGGELFKGFMAALLVVLLPIFIFSSVLVVTYGQASQSWAVYQLMLFVIVYPVLKALAQYRARRYRLARTSWRGIRGTMAGSPGEFAFLSWATSLLYPVTLGWIAPWRALYVQRFLICDTVLGDRRLRLGGSTSRLYLTFSLLYIGTLVIMLVVFYAIGTILGPQIGAMKTPQDWARVGRAQIYELAGVVFAALFVWSLVSSFYRASLYNMTANATVIMPPDGSTAPPLRFKLATKGPALIWLFVTNAALTYGSLFVLRPIATARTMRYFTRNLSLVGAFDPAMLRQNTTAMLSEGEGLAQAFDFDAF